MPQPPPLYGPPIDPGEVALAAGLWDTPVAWLLCVVGGLVVVGLSHRRGSTLGMIAGAVLGLTAPVGGMLADGVWGHFPTIDKAGSLHFYGLGAHFHAFDLSFPSTQLIGVSMGHLWVTQILDWLSPWIEDARLPGFAAMNAQGLLNVVLGWYFASRLAEEAGSTREVALVAGFPFGMGLHLFRDLNWYTIEKSGTGWLALYAWMLLRAHRRGGGWIVAAAVAYAWAFFYNSYWGILGAVIGAGALLIGNRSCRLAVVASALAVVPLVAIQLPHLANATLPPASAFADRAALDVLTLWPPAWNRLELWRAVDPVVTCLAIVGAASAFLRTARARDAPGFPSPTDIRWLVGGMALTTVLALGPATPVWTAFSSLPGMWRFAKPETFFHITVLGSCVLAGRSLSNLAARFPHALGVASALQLAFWLLLVHLHAVYPAFSVVPR